VKAFGGMKLREINVEAVDAFKSQRTHLKPHTLANILTLLRSMLRVAVKLQWLAVVPDFDKPKVQIFSHDYHYLRNDAEIARVLRAAANEGALVYALFAVAVYTGLRAGEIAGLEWGDVDFERRLIRVERSYDGPTTKSGRVRWVPLLDPLLPILRAWKLRHPGQLVFSGESGQRLGKSARVFQEVLKRVLVAAGFEPEKDGGREVHYITFHGLRHTFASSWVAKGGDVFKLQKILGHQSIMLTMRYAHLAPSMYASEHALLGTEAAHVENATVIKLRTRNVKLGATALPQSAPSATQGCEHIGGLKQVTPDLQEGHHEKEQQARGIDDGILVTAPPHLRRARS
jgi:integrase